MSARDIFRFNKFNGNLIFKHREREKNVFIRLVACWMAGWFACMLACCAGEMLYFFQKRNDINEYSVYFSLFFLFFSSRSVVYTLFKFNFLFLAPHSQISPVFFSFIWKQKNSFSFLLHFHFHNLSIEFWKYFESDSRKRRRRRWGISRKKKNEIDADKINSNKTVWIGYLGIKMKEICFYKLDFEVKAWIENIFLSYSNFCFCFFFSYMCTYTICFHSYHFIFLIFNFIQTFHFHRWHSEDINSKLSVCVRLKCELKTKTRIEMKWKKWTWSTNRSKCFIIQIIVTLLFSSISIEMLRARQ